MYSRIMTLALCGLATTALSQGVAFWRWWWEPTTTRIAEYGCNRLTPNNGAHAVAVFDYFDGTTGSYELWTTVVYSRTLDDDHTARSVEFRTAHDEEFFDLQIDMVHWPEYVCVATNGGAANSNNRWTHAAWLERQPGVNFPYARTKRRSALGGPEVAWGRDQILDHEDVLPGYREPQIAVASFVRGDEYTGRACAVYGTHDLTPNNKRGLASSVSYNNGYTWDLYEFGGISGT